MYKFIIVMMSLFLSACMCERGARGIAGSQGLTGTPGSNGHNSLMTSSKAGLLCPNDGETFRSGLDLNDNGVLDSSEVTNTALVCNGNSGSNGVDGAAGHDAAQIVITTSPATISQCVAGGTVLTVGAAQVITCAGLKGDKGNAGTNATPVSMIKLCPQIDHYPNVFVEEAICLNGNLYAVYSIPNAFLTLLTPGSYTSQGIGSSCNLTVGTNCQVTH